MVINKSFTLTVIYIFTTGEKGGGHRSLLTKAIPIFKNKFKRNIRLKGQTNAKTEGGKRRWGKILQMVEAAKGNDLPPRLFLLI